MVQAKSNAKVREVELSSSDLVLNPPCHSDDLTEQILALGVLLLSGCETHSQPDSQAMARRQ